ncbi:hypothetical protein [Ammoniphilus sp. YIM 78166]|uniref:hypothetical protein n=1 Tax=Ammoniphilus sp. YIM 78166 TaxID=1644106 RepID=UPI001430698D|nr:hypothetical protein [Ammoniphilus sp. YIM 78166]
MPGRKQPNQQQQFKNTRLQEKLNHQAETIESLQATEQDNAQPIASVQRDKIF